ncbi:MAG TPA: EamA family transporter, partial [Roseiflexaceae bacterium]|nr:EamA family transporter [Roseiflexaceae bacterium]
METNLTARANSRRGLVLILLAAILWGTVGVATQGLYHLTDTNALSIGFFRLAIATPALAAACWATLGRRAFKIAPRDLVFMLLIGAATAGYQVCYFAAIARVGVAVAVLITLCTAPVIVALASAVLLRERLSATTLLALACALGGAALLVLSTTGIGGERRDTLAGVLLALLSALGYALIAMFSRTVAGRYHPLQPITVGFGAGALMLLPFALAAGLVSVYPVAGWLLLLHLGLLPTALAYGLFLAGLRHTTATVASVVTLIEPLTSTLLAWLLFGERLGWLGLVGAALLFGAIALLYWGASQPARADRSERVQLD